MHTEQLILRALRAQNQLFKPVLKPKDNVLFTLIKVCTFSELNFGCNQLAALEEQTILGIEAEMLPWQIKQPMFT